MPGTKYITSLRHALPYISFLEFQLPWLCPLAMLATTKNTSLADVQLCVCRVLVRQTEIVARVREECFNAVACDSLARFRLQGAGHQHPC